MNIKIDENGIITLIWDNGWKTTYTKNKTDEQNKNAINIERKNLAELICAMAKIDPYAPENFNKVFTIETPFRGYCKTCNKIFIYNYDKKCSICKKDDKEMWNWDEIIGDYENGNKSVK